jgi:oligosaccharide repeat unit polymerase
MIAFPFLFFLVLSIYYINKYGFNIGSLLLLLYTLSFATALPLYYRFDTYSDLKVSFSSMIYLVFLLLLWLLPILKFTRSNYTLCENAPLTKFNVLSYFLLFTSILTYVFLLPNGIHNIRNLDIALVRSDSMNGNVQIYTKNSTLNFIISNLIAFYPISLFFFFYSISFMKRKKLFNFLLFISSTSVIVFSFMYVARGEIVYWSLMFVFLYTFFRKSLSKDKRTKVLILFCTVAILGIIYFSIVSLARFEDSDHGITYAILDYSGQSVINFGNIFDHFTSFQNGTLNFPFFQRILGLPYRGGIVDYFNKVATDTGFSLNIFYTFIGSLFIDFGPLVTFILVIIVSFFGFKLFKKSEEIPFYRIFLMILYCQIPLQGLFIFNLLNEDGNKYILLTILLSGLFKYKIVLSKTN